MTLIELHTRSGGLWINPEYIARLEPAGPGSAVYIGADSSLVLVKEKPEEIIQLIKSAQNQ